MGNLTRYEAKNIVDYELYGSIWGQVFDWAPDFDPVSPQDSMGAQGNSFQNVTDCLGNITLNGLHAERPRTTWSNVELFERWPYPSGNGRHPGEFGRIQQQITNEWNVLQKVGGVSEPVLIAWEWYSCLSPNGGENNEWANVTKENYDLYKAWVMKYL